MDEDPRETYRRAVERLLGVRSGLPERVLELAAGDGIARGELLKRLKLRTAELDALLGTLLAQGAIELAIEQTGGRKRIRIIAKPR
jgi:hypothetical protein